jgi:hypothetical protein
MSHPLEKEFGLTSEKVLDIIQSAFRLKIAVKGGVAEKHLLDYLLSCPLIEDVVHLDKDDRPDFEITYGGELLLVECKNVSPQGKVDLQKARHSKGDPHNRFYKDDRFDILAASMQPLTGKWEFKFCPTVDLDPHPYAPGRLDTKVSVEGPEWNRTLEEILPHVRTRTKDRWEQNTLFVQV